MAIKGLFNGGGEWGVKTKMSTVAGAHYLLCVVDYDLILERRASEELSQE